MANEEWMVLGFGHKANREIVYDWSYMKTDCDLSTISQAERERLMETYWLKVSKNPDRSFDWASAFFLSKDNVGQTAIEDELNALGVAFTTVDVTPTEAQKKLIAKHRVARRDRMKEVLETFEPIQSAFDAEVLKGKTPAQIDAYIDTNVTDLASTREFLKKLSKTVLYMAKYVNIED